MNEKIVGMSFPDMDVERTEKSLEQRIREISEAIFDLFHEKGVSPPDGIQALVTCLGVTLGASVKDHESCRELFSITAERFGAVMESVTDKRFLEDAS